MVRKGLRSMKVDISHYEDINDLEFTQGVRIKQKSRNKVKQTNKDPMKKGKGKKPRSRRDFRK